MTLNSETTKREARFEVFENGSLILAVTVPSTKKEVINQIANLLSDSKIEDLHVQEN